MDIIPLGIGLGEINHVKDVMRRERQKVQENERNEAQPPIRAKLVFGASRFGIPSLRETHV